MAAPSQPLGQAELLLCPPLLLPPFFFHFQLRHKIYSARCIKCIGRPALGPSDPGAFPQEWPGLSKVSRPLEGLRWRLSYGVVGVVGGSRPHGFSLGSVGGPGQGWAAWGLQRRECERLLSHMGVHSFISTTQKERELLHLLRGSLPR